MKRAIVVLLLSAALVGAMGARAYAGDREWAVAGKVLAGLIILDALTSSGHGPTVVYEQPVVYQPPVAYQPPVVYQPTVVHRPRVFHHPPTVLRPPVRRHVGWGRMPTVRQQHYRPGRSFGPAYRVGFRRGLRTGYPHGVQRGRGRR